MEETKKLLEQVLAANILMLAHQIKQEKKSKGVTSTSDFTAEAATLIRQRQQELYRLLR